MRCMNMLTASQQLAAKRAYGTNKDGSVPSYLEQEVMSWDKEKIILKMYDLFLVSAKRNDVPKMSKILIELMGSLNFEIEDTATRLYRLYEYTQRCLFQKNIDEASFIIKELRDAWAKAFNYE